MFALCKRLGAVGLVATLAAGCNTGLGSLVPTGGSTDPDVAAAASKATQVAGTIGGQTGFGGLFMDGYFDHAPAQMGFLNPADLATADGEVVVRLHNDADEDCTFHLAYFAEHEGLDEQTMDVDVPAGADATVRVPCAEILGMGTLDTPGVPGCHLADGLAVPNTMAVPGFLGLDYQCGGTYEYSLTPDVDDLDGDGDTTELIIISDGMRFHMMGGGPFGHRHGFGMGMMGPHFGG